MEEGKGRGEGGRRGGGVLDLFLKYSHIVACSNPFRNPHAQRL